MIAKLMRSIHVLQQLELGLELRRMQEQAERLLGVALKPCEHFDVMGHLRKVGDALTVCPPHALVHARI